MGRRLNSREIILREANAFIRRRKSSVRTLSARHINEAVCICRQHELVGWDVLAWAGFRPTKRRG